MIDHHWWYLKYLCNITYHFIYHLFTYIYICIYLFLSQDNKNIFTNVKQKGIGVSKTRRPKEKKQVYTAFDYELLYSTITVCARFHATTIKLQTTEQSLLMSLQTSGFAQNLINVRSRRSPETKVAHAQCKFTTCYHGWSQAAVQYSIEPNNDHGF